jgi:hypothetical protein
MFTTQRLLLRQRYGLHAILVHSIVCTSTNPCVATDTWWSSDPIPFGWFAYHDYPGTFVYVIAAWTTTCPPPCNCPNTPGTAQAPISLASGYTFVEQVDVKISGLGGGLRR